MTQIADKAVNQNEQDPRVTIAHLFRARYGRMIAALVRHFGLPQLAHVETALQEAGVRAIEHWRSGQLPRSPENWLVRVAYNLLLNDLRRERAL